MIKYVVGFLFSPDLKRVALVRKNRPAWQAGLLNGIGGKIESGETSLEAMTREFSEEAGVWITEWNKFAFMSESEEFGLDFFATVGDVESVETKTDEVVGIYRVSEIQKLKTIENIPWLLLLAKDVLEDGRPEFVNINYTNRER